MSNGGFMNYRLACELGTKIAAIASVTGSMTPETLEACNPAHQRQSFKFMEFLITPFQEAVTTE